MLKRLFNLETSCRQEMMDLVNKSGKFSKKFEAFTGEAFGDIFVDTGPTQNKLCYSFNNYPKVL